MHSTLMIEAMLSDYLGSPWGSDRRRRFVHVVVRVASLFSRGIELEASVLLPLYLPPGQYRYVMDEAGRKSPDDEVAASLPQRQQAGSFAFNRWMLHASGRAVERLSGRRRFALCPRCRAHGKSSG